MHVTQKKPSAKAGGQSLKVGTIIPQHYCMVDNVRLLKQPRNEEMGRITNRFKMRGIAKRYGIDEILEALGNGYCVIPSNVEVERRDGQPLTADTPAKERKMTFQSATFFMLDIDDDDEKTNPKQVLEGMSKLAAGLFYTFSHGIKGNRYRLLFQLDKPVRDEQKLKLIMDLLSKELRKQGIPTDEGQGKNTTMAIRPGIKGFVVNDYRTCLNTDEWIEKAVIEQNKRLERLKQSYEHTIRFTPTFEMLKEAADRVGYIASGTGRYQDWTTIALGIKQHAETGAITEEQGYELFSIISGPETSDAVWEGMKPNGRATIGTLLYHAQQSGFKLKKSFMYATETSAPGPKTEIIKVNRHIPESVARELIERKERLLVDSPTGSGKTKSFIGAFKELADSRKRHFYIFAAPTRALTEQISSTYGVTGITGSQEKLFRRVSEKIQQGDRVFVVTYDLAPVLAEFIMNGRNDSRFTLVIDEIHKFVTDYAKTYRFNAINELYKTSLKAVSFIGLSGTTSDVLTDDFDKVIRIKNGEEASPCQEFGVYTYEKSKESDAMLVHLVKAWTKKRRLLIFIQQKERIDRLYKILNRQGIKTARVTSDEKRSSTYRNLIEKEAVADDVQVVLATSVIADGINIQNTLEWECIAVCDKRSPLFNISTLKQISNRLRGTYRRFSIYMQEPKQPDEKLFNINAAYRYNKRIAESFTELINKEFSGADLRLFRPSVLENDYGLYVDEKQLLINPLHLRYMAAQSKERYYYGKRKAFVIAIEKILHKKHSLLNISEEVRNKRLEVPEIQAELERLEEENKETQSRKRENISGTFTKNVYEAFQTDDEEILQEFKRQSVPAHYACIKRLHEFADFPTCEAVLANVKRDADTNAFLNQIISLVDISYFHSIDRMSPTKRVFLAIAELNDFIPVAEMKELFAAMPRKLRVQEKDVKKVKKMFVYQQSRTKKERLSKAEPLTVEAVAKEWGLTVDQVKTTMRKYVETQPKAVQIAARNYYGL